MKLVLGIDPGSRVTGWGTVRGPAASPALERCGAIRLPVALSFPERLHRLGVEIERIIAAAGPCSAAVETPFHGANARSALQLAHARGVILAALAANGIPIFEYEPATVKKAVTGNGRADKGQVQAMVERILATSLGEASPDLYDALAVALCHLQTQPQRDRVAAALARSRGKERSSR